MELEDAERDALAFVMVAADDLIGAPMERLRYLAPMVSGALAALWNPDAEDADAVVAEARAWLAHRPVAGFTTEWERINR